MILLTDTQRDRLLANGRDRDQDHIPVLKFFNPFGAGVWLATELDEDGDIVFGLSDIGDPELGSWSLNELRSIRLPFDMGIERDLLFTGPRPPAKPAAFAMPSACFIARAACQVGHDLTWSLRVPEGFCSFGAALFAGRGRRFSS
ncbi:conserved hypothetical protein [Citreicella sp. SE45]|nr:conserved hypothetical protein [Citreicella sp. SE45]